MTLEYDVRIHTIIPASGWWAYGHCTPPDDAQAWADPVACWALVDSRCDDELRYVTALTAACDGDLLFAEDLGGFEGYLLAPAQKEADAEAQKRVDWSRNPQRVASQ